jgi:DNA replication protein DnaC
MEEEAARRHESNRIAYVERIAKINWSETAKWFSQDNGHLPKVSDVCRRYVEEWQEMYKSGTGILFYGDVERGKTFMATCIASELFKRGVKSYVTTISRIISQMGAAFEGEAFLHEVCKWHLLVIDDLGTDWGSTFSTSRAFDAINARVACGKPTIFTTNLSLQDMQNAADIAQRRIYSRVLGACPIKLLLESEPQRQRTAEQKRRLAIKNLFRKGGSPS